MLSGFVMDYERYLGSARWRKKRLAIILRADGICERCRKAQVSFVHHLTYERIGNEHLGDLLGVCAKCHEELHDGGRVRETIVL